MRPSCFSKFFILFVLLFAATLSHASLHQKSALLYYGDGLSYPMAGIHDYVIVQPDHTDTTTHGFAAYRDKLYAYVSIGEADPDAAYFERLDPSWLLGSNPRWKSRVADLRNPAYRRFLLEELIAPLAAKGFKHFFFDTLDSYQLVAKDEKSRAAHRRGAETFIADFARAYPDAKLIVNRGFELLDAIHPHIEAMLFESYYRGLSGESLAYAPVSDDARAWLDTQLERVKARGIPLICVDYLPPEEMKHAPELIEALVQKGFVPYVGDRLLRHYGRSTKNPVKREILIITDAHIDNGMDETGAHRIGSLPLEYLGYVPLLRPLSEGLPDAEHAATRYGGVVLWLSGEAKRPDALLTWITQLHAAGIPTLFINAFGLPETAKYLDALKISSLPNSAPFGSENQIVRKDPMMGFEIEPSALYRETLLQPESAEPLFSYRTNQDQHCVTAALTPWGGYALSGTAYIETLGEIRWAVDPFALYARTLRLKSLPVPDPTTENGSRLLFSHVDGDGFANRAEWESDRFASEVLYDEIFTRYPIAHSVSLIEAEIAPHGLYPELSPRLEKRARSIFALENVEAATHTFSHPFQWLALTENLDDPSYNLTLPGYRFNVERELLGSLDYIATLLPQGRRNPRMLFWTGDCMPPASVVSYAYAHNIANINGGDTTITKRHPWLSRIAPLGIKKGEHYQIFTGAQNENVYTNNFTSMFWGFKNVIQTFELTDRPRRFKPIDIYYHFYAGSKRASLRALTTVFEWATAQRAMPIYTSEYLPKVQEFYDISLTSDGGEWLIAGMSALRTLRLDTDATPYAASPEVVGLTPHATSTYLSLLPDGPVYLEPDAPATLRPLLLRANAKLTAVTRSEGHTRFDFKGLVDLQVALHLPGGCSLQKLPDTVSHSIEGPISRLRFDAVSEASIDVLCK